MGKYNVAKLIAGIINRRKIKITCLVGAPSTGKTTLIEGLRLSTTYVAGFLSCDMSDIMKWHRDTNNKSPFAEEFIQAKLIQDAGNLIEDSLVFAGLIWYLLIMQTKSEIGELRYVLLSGFPRTLIQYQTLHNLFPKMHAAYVYCTETEGDKNRLARIASGISRNDDKPETFQGRWIGFNSLTLPAVNEMRKKLGNEQFFEFPFSDQPHVKSTRLLKTMGLDPITYRSMLHQLITPGCDAWEYFEAVGKPKQPKVNSMPLQQVLTEVRAYA